jgi:hypothetical protein
MLEMNTGTVATEVEIGSHLGYIKPREIHILGFRPPVLRNVMYGPL